MKQMFKKISRITSSALRRTSKKESWKRIMKRYKDLPDGEFIDTLMEEYHPPRRKSK